MLVSWSNVFLDETEFCFEPITKRQIALGEFQQLGVYSRAGYPEFFWMIDCCVSDLVSIRLADGIRTGWNTAVIYGGDLFMKRREQYIGSAMAEPVARIHWN